MVPLQNWYYNDLENYKCALKQANEPMHENNLSHHLAYQILYAVQLHLGCHLTSISIA